ncbi:MAG: hypothetical protein K2K70_09670 [Lachnospiraceae bacterium]|nr:hypothetical protein [Lachnospiraceae bacterium]
MDKLLYFFVFTKCVSVDIINIGELAVHMATVPIRPRKEKDGGSRFSPKFKHKQWREGRALHCVNGGV